jgi:hypothetical protein
VSVTDRESGGEGPFYSAPALFEAGGHSLAKRILMSRSPFLSVINDRF